MIKLLNCKPTLDQARLRHLACRLSILLAASLAGLFGLALVMTAAGDQAAAAPFGNGTLYSSGSGDFFFPPYPSENNRFGISVGGGITIERFDVAQLHAGWYLDWAAKPAPPHPDQLEYGRTIYLNVLTGDCGMNKPPASIITQVSHVTGSALIDNLASNPGALWMIGNEPDSIYNCSPVMPDTYAQLYHNLYTFIKQRDPSARVAIGAIIQPTPLRLEYLDKVRDAYYQYYSTTLPTDLWNIHLYALREEAGGWGGGTPPGATHNGIYYPMRASIDISTMSGLVRDMRTWMAARGERDKPLIITEYGVLWPADYCDPEQPDICFTEPAVTKYMTQTFEYFLNATDPAIGYGADGNRLVQLWNWYATNDNNIYNGDLFYLNGNLSVIGQAYAAYAAPRTTAYNDQALWAFKATPATGSEQVTVSLQAIAAEMGNTPSSSATVEFYSKPFGGSDQLVSTHAIQQTLSRYSGTVSTSSRWVTTSPGVYTLRAELVPGGADARPANNTRSVTLDLRPDMTARISVTTKPAISDTVTATAHMTMNNTGLWPARDILEQIVVSDSLSGQQVFSDSRAFSVMPKASRPLTYILPITRPSVYVFSFLADAGGKLSEPNTANNLATCTLDIRSDLAWSNLSHTPALPFLGDLPTLTVTSSATLSNIGAYPSPELTLTMQVKQESSPPQYVKLLHLASLAPGQSVPISFTWTASSAGVYSLTLSAPMTDTSVERDVANNTITQQVLVASDRCYLPLIFRDSTIQ